MSGFEKNAWTYEKGSPSSTVPVRLIVGGTSPGAVARASVAVDESAFLSQATGTLIRDA
jgi:hypothetical protein